MEIDSDDERKAIKKNANSKDVKKILEDERKSKTNSKKEPEKKGICSSCILALMFFQGF